MWMDEKEISKAIYNKCLKDDQEKFWSLITDSEWAYWYCRYVVDRPEVRKHITDSRWAYCYSKDVVDRPEIRKNIKNML